MRDNCIGRAPTVTSSKTLFGVSVLLFHAVELADCNTSQTVCNAMLQASSPFPASRHWAAASWAVDIARGLEISSLVYLSDSVAMEMAAACAMNIWAKSAFSQITHK
jgi:hypothetical protein